MGRGLSELQKTILRRALSNREQDAARADEIIRLGERPDIDILGSEVAADYFGWPLPYRDFYGYHPWRHAGFEGIRPNRLDAPFGVSGRMCRRPKGVSPEQANRVHAAISRAFARLQERDLAEALTGRCRWSGLILTPEGIEAARQLSVNRAESYRSVNH